MGDGPRPGDAPELEWALENLQSDKPTVRVFPRQDPPSTGTVRARMFDADGRPFAGGHVCFYSESYFAEPEAWDGVTASDGAYFGIPHYKGLWPHYDPVIGSGRSIPVFETARSVTDADGFANVSIPAGRRLVVFVRYKSSGIPLRIMERVEVREGETIDVTIQASRERVVSGRCIDARGVALEGIAVQAVAARDERPLSRVGHSTQDGHFTLDVFGDDPEVRVRAVTNPAGYQQPIRGDDDLPPIPADTTIADVVPGGAPVEIRMPDADVVLLELVLPEGETPLTHLQIEGLAYDASKDAWGRLGGPQFKRVAGATGRRNVVAVPRVEAERPWMLWSWGWTITAVDPRGRDRVTVSISRGRPVKLTFDGSRAGDVLRVVAFCGPKGEELPSIWIESGLGPQTEWGRGDCPVAAMEFIVLREGSVVARSPRIPAGTERHDLKLEIR